MLHTEKDDRDEMLPSVLVILGFNGNLSKNKLLPALYHLLKRNMLTDSFRIIGVFRSSEITTESIFQEVESNLLESEQPYAPQFLEQLKAITTPVIMDSTKPEDYQTLVDTLDKLDSEQSASYQRLFYLAIPPAIFPAVIDCLVAAGQHIDTNGRVRRILVEKPFGTDLTSAKELVRVMATHFKETQIYRIDHYLAKENVQNILAFRFGNPLIEDIWGRQFIDNIQISALEKIGVDSRSNFYEGMGALRDFVQSHLMQLMVLIMMEAPDTFDSDGIHRAKFALLQSVDIIRPNHVDEIAVRGQYEGYREEIHNEESNVETYAALCLHVSNSRWAGVPVFLRTGKSLHEYRTEIKIIFKDRYQRKVPPNIITIRIQPDEGISMNFSAKAPGFKDRFQPVNMQFNYHDSFNDSSPDAYERVLVDCVQGDQSLFATHEEVMRCWEILQEVINTWNSGGSKPEMYPVGSWGPVGATSLAQNFKVDWV